MDAFFVPAGATALTLGRVFSLDIEMPSQPDLIAVPLQAHIGEALARVGLTVPMAVRSA